MPPSIARAVRVSTPAAQPPAVHRRTIRPNQPQRPGFRAKPNSRYEERRAGEMKAGLVWDLRFVRLVAHE
jgi:hypothetical protein